jgi:predicted dehydrogenase
VYAVLRRGAGQAAAPPLVGSAIVEFDQAIGSIALAGSTPHGAVDRTVIAGTQGTLVAQGRDINHQSVALYTAAGTATPEIEGTWFTNGFEGTMGELLCAIEEDRAPYNSAANNLESLAVAFAAIASAERGQPVRPGDVRRLEPQWFRAH